VSFRVGIGVDAHKLERGVPLILGGVRFDFDRGLSGHSDGDVLAHALIDALLGAAGLGDIGQHFPDTDSKYHEIDSRELLRDVAKKLKAQKLKVVNIDATIVAQEPRTDIRGNGEKVFQTQLALYQKYTRAIEAVAKDNNVKTAYFIQPVPSWGKTLTEDEKRAAGANMTDPVLYRRIVEGMLTLRERGLAIFDLGDLLKDVTETVYADDIHFIRDTKGDSKGYRLMARRVTDDLAKSWDLKAKTGN
jgi:2-C-methyl-D-erythritol 2,4-cyclodiphosphate synthase